jgi:cytochrome P450
MKSELPVLDIELGDPQPHERLAVCRRSGQVARGPGDEAEHFHVTSWDDVDSVLRAPEGFSSRRSGETLGRFTGPSMLQMDGDAHRANRSIVAQAFKPSSIDRWAETLIRPIVRDLVSSVAPHGSAELVRSVTYRFSVQVICGMYGVPLEDADQFHRWADRIVRGLYDPEPGLAARREMTEYLRPFVEQRRRLPSDDLLSELIAAADDGKMSEEELYGSLLLILVGGTATTNHGFANTLTALLTHRPILDAVLDDRSLVPTVVEESLRWEAPAQRSERLIVGDVAIGGCPLPKGAAVGVWLGSANRDESRFEAPDEFRLSRPFTQHMAFGAGRHICLGMHLARTELRIGVEEVLDGLPDIRLDPDRPAPVIQGTLQRGAPEVWVRFTPRR